jgi:hypothetical protein
MKRFFLFHLIIAAVILLSSYASCTNEKQRGSVNPDDSSFSFVYLSDIHLFPDKGATKAFQMVIDSTQIEWIKQDLHNLDRNTPIALSVHIPFLTVFPEVDQGALASNSKGLVINNSKEVLELFENHNLKLVLQGHLHFLEDIYVKGTHFITAGAVSGSWWNGPRDGLEEGFLKVDVSGHDFNWEYVDYGWEAMAGKE